MRVRAAIRSLGLCVLFLACREEIPELEPVWPPREGTFCGDAPDTCDADGTPWICGSRPIWQRIDCATRCAKEGGEPHGCFIQENDDIVAVRERLAPLGFVDDTLQDAAAELSSARCLCKEAADFECAGPAHAICADRSQIWSCTDTRTWEKQDCAAKCMALDPPMVLNECYHGLSHDEDECRCTLLGAPCSVDGELVCAGDTEWLRCVDGVWEFEVSCKNACTFSDTPTCDRFETGVPACRCEEGG